MFQGIAERSSVSQKTNRELVCMHCYCLPVLVNITPNNKTFPLRERLRDHEHCLVGRPDNLSNKVTSPGRVGSELGSCWQVRPGGSATHLLVLASPGGSPPESNSFLSTFGGESLRCENNDWLSEQQKSRIYWMPGPGMARTVKMLYSPLEDTAFHCSCCSGGSLSSSPFLSTKSVLHKYFLWNNKILSWEDGSW